MIPDTSQTASAEATASRLAVEDENTRFTVWSIPSNTWGSTFGSMAGPIVCRHSCCWRKAPRMPSTNSVHATAAMNMRSAIALRIGQQAVAVEQVDPEPDDLLEALPTGAHGACSVPEPADPENEVRTS